MNEFILTLKDQQIFESKYSGGKGSNLARLTKEGFNVPFFFILSSSLYEYIIRINGLNQFIEKSVSQYSIENFKQIQSAILAVEIPESIIMPANAELKKLAQNSQIRMAAVRSSALAEDLPDRSFAGQLESYLNIQDENQLWDSIKKCWASLWNERFYAYVSRQKSFTPQAMAVIVQQMIPAEYSGICFTVDPMDMNQEWMLIETQKGPGSDLVGGKVNPLRYRVHRKTLEIRADATNIDIPKRRKELIAHRFRKLRESTQKYQFISNGVPCLCHQNFFSFLPKFHLKKSHERPNFILEDKIPHLVTTGLKIEKYFKAPQDIEWAFYQNQFYIIQSRPITARVIGQIEHPKRRWTSYFLGERFPNPVSPLGWSLLKPLIEKNAFREPLQLLGFHKLARSQITKCFYGRPYTRLEVFTALHTLFPTAFVSIDKRQLFYNDKEVTIDDCFKRMAQQFFPILKSILKTTDWIPPIHLRNWKRFLGYYEQQIKKINKLALDRFSSEELWQLNLRAEALDDQLLNLHRWSITLAELIYHFLIFLIREWLPQENAEKVIMGLHRGVADNKTVDMNIELWKLSCQLKTNPCYRSEGWDRHLTATQSWRSFVKEFGHRSTSLDIYVPTFKEDFNYISELVNQCLSQPIEISPETLQNNFEQGREELFQNVYHKLSKQPLGRLKKILFKIFLNWSVQLILLRENQRHYWHKVLAIHRKLFREIGARFHNNGWLELPDRIFFLTRSEIDQIIRQEAGNDIYFQEIALRASKRFEQCKRWEKIQPPPQIDEAAANRVDQFRAQNTLTGIGVSPGLVTGRARVLRSLPEMSRLKLGEIMVVPTTDPGWTPLFGVIKGLVMEVGGVLSHGAIIAREYGIPAVANVERATFFIQTGVSITIDGNLGLVLVNES